MKAPSTLFPPAGGPAWGSSALQAPAETGTEAAVSLRARTISSLHPWLRGHSQHVSALRNHSRYSSHLPNSGWQVPDDKEHTTLSKSQNRSRPEVMVPEFPGLYTGVPAAATQALNPPGARAGVLCPLCNFGVAPFLPGPGLLNCKLWVPANPTQAGPSPRLQKPGFQGSLNYERVWDTKAHMHPNSPLGPPPASSHELGRGRRKGPRGAARCAPANDGASSTKRAGPRGAAFTSIRSSLLLALLPAAPGRRRRGRRPGPRGRAQATPEGTGESLDGGRGPRNRRAPHPAPAQPDPPRQRAPALPSRPAEPPGRHAHRKGPSLPAPL